MKRFIIVSENSEATYKELDTTNFASEANRLSLHYAQQTGEKIVILCSTADHKLRRKLPNYLSRYLQCRR